MLIPHLIPQTPLTKVGLGECRSGTGNSYFDFYFTNKPGAESPEGCREYCSSTGIEFVGLFIFPAEKRCYCSVENGNLPSMDPAFMELHAITSYHSGNSGTGKVAYSDDNPSLTCYKV